MTPEQKAAYINAQTVCALAEIESMKAANAERERRGLSQAYPEQAFAEVAGRFGITHNQVVELFINA